MRGAPLRCSRTWAAHGKGGPAWVINHRAGSTPTAAASVARRTGQLGRVALAHICASSVSLLERRRLFASAAHRPPPPPPNQSQERPRPAPKQTQPGRARAEESSFAALVPFGAPYLFSFAFSVCLCRLISSERAGRRASLSAAPLRLGAAARNRFGMNHRSPYIPLPAGRFRQRRGPRANIQTRPP